MMKKFRSRSSFTKLFSSFVILISIILLFLSMVIYDSYEKQTIRQTSAASQQILAQTAYAVDFVWDWSSNYLFDLYNDGNVYNGIYSKDVSIIETINANTKITKAMSNSLFLESIYLYNGNIQKLFSTKDRTLSVAEFYDQDIIKLLKNKEELKLLHFIPRKVKYSINGKDFNENILTLIASEGPDVNGNLEGALIINVKESYIQSILKSMAPYTDDVTMLIDEKGRIISNSDPKEFLKNVSSEGYIKSVLASKGSSGQFTENIRGEKSLVTFIASNKLKWKIIQITPYGKIVAKAYYMRNLILILCFILLVIGVITSFVISRKFYSPIQKLVKKASDVTLGTIEVKPGEKHELEYVSDLMINMKDELIKVKHQSWDDLRLIRNELLKELLLKGYTQGSELGNRVKDLNIDFENKDIVVYILRIDDFLREVSNAYSMQDLALYRFAIANIAQELTAKVYNNETVDIGEDIIAVIVNTMDESLYSVENSLKQIVNQIQEEVQKHFNFSLSCSIGQIQKDIKDINKSYNTALKNSNYRLIYGKRSIITEDLLNLYDENKYHYTEDIFMPVLNNLKLRKYNLVEEQVKRFFVRLRKMAYDDIIITLSQIVHDSISVINLMNSYKDSENAYSFKTLRDEIEKFDTLEEIKEWLLCIYKKETETLDDNSKNAKKEYVDMVINLIQNEFNDPGLNIEGIAERIGLSVNYLRAIFKEISGTSLTDYINKFRYEKAMELLIHSDMTVAAISEKIGMNSENHFYTFFKRFNGLTPTQFRKKEQI